MMQANPNCPARERPGRGRRRERHPVQDPAGHDAAARRAEERLGVRTGSRTPPARSCGRRASGAAASRAECTSAWRCEGGTLFVPIADLADGHDGRKYDSAPRPGLYALDLPSGTNAVVGAGAAGLPRAQVLRPGHLGAADRDSRGRVCRPYGRAGCGPTTRQRRQGALAVRRERAGAHGVRRHGARRLVRRSGAAVRDGYLVINSGYGLYFHMPGNVLLVFHRPARPQPIQSKNCRSISCARLARIGGTRRVVERCLHVRWNAASCLKRA